MQTALGLIQAAVSLVFGWYYLQRNQVPAYHWKVTKLHFDGFCSYQHKPTCIGKTLTGISISDVAIKSTYQLAANAKRCQTRMKI